VSNKLIETVASDMYSGCAPT